MQILNNIIGKHIGIGEIIKISKRLILNPKDIQARLISFQNLINTKSAPATIGIFVRPRFLTFMTILGL